MRIINDSTKDMPQDRNFTLAERLGISLDETVITHFHIINVVSFTILS